MRNNRRIGFSEYVTYEMLRRLLEMLGLGTILSLLDRICLATGLFSFINAGIFSVISCGIFQAVNIWLCRKSNSRVRHYRPDYYLSNLAGCLLYGMIGLLCLLLTPQWFFNLFNITICLTGKQQVNLHELILIYARFFLLTATIIVLAKEWKYLPRMVRKQE